MLEKVDFDNDRIEWLCHECKAPQACPITDLTVGGRADEADDPIGCPDVIYLKPCTSCVLRSEVFIIRTKGDTDNQQRLIINAVFEHVREHGKVHSKAAPVYAAEKKAGTGIVATAARKGSHDDITGARATEEARAKAQAESEAATAAMAEQVAAEFAALMDERAKATEVLAAAASINKRLGRPPGTKPTLEEINAELGDAAVDAEIPSDLLESSETSP